LRAAFAQALIDQGGLIGEFQEPDFRYRKPRIDGDHFKVKLYFSAQILALPGELIV